MKLSSILNGILNWAMTVLLPEVTYGEDMLVSYLIGVGKEGIVMIIENEMKLLIRNVSLLMIKDSFETIMNLKMEWL